MSIVKSFSVGNGDMFYIRHGSDNFSIIDCCMDQSNEKAIVEEIQRESADKGVIRFISSHPDADHIQGLAFLDGEIGIRNFYCVKNEATKPDKTEDFDLYCDLRDSAEKAFYIYEGCRRRWMNKDSDERTSAGISILWPNRDNQAFKDALKKAADGGSPNNISPIVRYSLKDGVKMLWMGDLETEFMETIKDQVELGRAHILFAPHHGRDSGKVPEALLDDVDPLIVVIGEAPAKHLNYYAGYDSLTQNSAGDIVFDCEGSNVSIYVQSDSYTVEFLADHEESDTHGHYLGTLELT